MGALEQWAASGAMALTGRADGPPLASPGRPAAVVAKGLASLGFTLPGLLSERAAHAGLGRRAPWSCGGASRALPTSDGHLVLTLARPSDIELLPALIEDPVVDPWSDVARWAARTSTREAAERVRLLGLPGGAVPTAPPDDRPGVLTRVHGRRRVVEEPVVVDLTSLWAGPLCARLLGLRGARVIKVESTTRPDGARSGPPGFFDLLHRGHEHVTLDFRAEGDRLRDLLVSADLVLEASRPRALRQLDIMAEDVVAGGTSWLSITAEGRASDAVGFGDDVAVRAGLHLRDGDDVIPVGDAIADPLAGIAAAVAAADALTADDARLIDVSMLHVAAEAARGPVEPHTTYRRDGRWYVETATGTHVVAEPTLRRDAVAP